MDETEIRGHETSFPGDDNFLKQRPTIQALTGSDK
jgi:hypothetical protein